MAAPARWALLCGGNFYIPGTHRDTNGQKIDYKPLKGCVNDVKSIEKLLLKAGVPKTNIVKLTAHRSATSIDKRPTEPEHVWPTAENIDRGLKFIERSAKRGDLVYFHFSGHGIRRARLPPDMRNDDGDTLTGTALVMTDVMIGKPYLTGYQLGVRIQHLVSMGLRVTVVLDSCFSGGGLRDDETTPRTLTDQLDETILECDLAADKAAEAMDPDLEYRDSHSVKRCWLSNPVGCTVLTACASNETAGERRQGTFGPVWPVHGILTHQLLAILGPDNSANWPPHSRVVQQVRQELRNLKIHQQPLIYGDGIYTFFGIERKEPRSFCQVTDSQSSHMILNVGSAQGVSVNAVYDILSAEASTSDNSRVICQAKVSNVSLFESVARPLGSTREIPKGSEAVLRRWALPDTWTVEFPRRYANHRRKLQDEFIRTGESLLLRDADNPNAEFQVTIDTEGSYEIWMDHMRIHRVPRIQVVDDKGIQKLAYTLNHLARYHTLRNLMKGPTGSSHLKAEDFIFNVSNAKDKISNESGTLSCAEEEDVMISLTYRSQQKTSVWVSLFCFTASWGIVKILPEADEGSASLYLQPHPAGEELSLSFEIPPKVRETDPSEIQDILVLVASTGRDQVSWDDLRVPPLPLPDFSNAKLAELTSGSDRDPGPCRRRSHASWVILERTVRTCPKRD